MERVFRFDPMKCGKCGGPMQVIACIQDDGVPDDTDNCALTVNAAQSNNDGDVLGDARDPDSDSDGVSDWVCSSGTAQPGLNGHLLRLRRKSSRS